MTCMNKRYYLAGPMSGIPHFNFPAFDMAAEELRRRGLCVISPAELDDPADMASALVNETGDPARAGKTWGQFLGRDVRIVADQCEGIIFLPGWETSRGACLEAYVGVLCGHDFFEYHNGSVTAVTREYVREKLL